MNRKFSVVWTPAKARLLKYMAEEADVIVDDAVFEGIDNDKISDEDFSKFEIVDDLDKKAIQFIIDSDFRAGIPISKERKPHALKLIRAAMGLAGMTRDDVYQITKGKSFADYSYEKLLPHRRKTLIVDLDDSEAVADHFIGCLFPKILIVGSMFVQYSFTFTTETSTPTKMAKILYPATEDSLKSTAKWNKPAKKTLISCGIFPEFIDMDFNNAPKLNKPLLIEVQHIR